MNLSVFIPCNPPTATAQQKGVFVAGGRPRFFKKKRVKDAEMTWHQLLAPHTPPEPMEGPLALVVRLAYPWRKSESKRRISRYMRYPIETRPDIDNLFKLLADVMTTLRFWNDDSQIASLSISKEYSSKPGVHITLTNALAIDCHGNCTSIE
jgi:Holliday junction resolvase RusA-like endonuclease